MPAARKRRSQKNVEVKLGHAALEKPGTLKIHARVAYILTTSIFCGEIIEKKAGGGRCPIFSSVARFGLD